MNKLSLNVALDRPGFSLRAAAEPPHHTFLTTGDAAAFHDLAELFLGRKIAQVHAVHVETGEDA